MASVICLLLLCFSLNLLVIATRASPLGQNLKKGLIVGGQNADPNQFPYMASLKRRNTNSHFCAGSILNEYWVLTAAHCAIDETVLTLEVSVGSHFINNGKTHRIQSIRNHPTFSRSTLANDIALLKVLENFQWSSSTRPIGLIDRQVSVGTLVVSGWGRTSTSGPGATTLQFIQTNAMSRSICERFISPNPDTFCTTNLSGKGICFGDSGGPLVLSNEGQVGVTSFVVNSCGGNYPDGYASVYYHKHWILQNISE